MVRATVIVKNVSNMRFKRFGLITSSHTERGRDGLFCFFTSGSHNSTSLLYIVLHNQGHSSAVLFSPGYKMIPACIFFTDVNLLVKRERERERERQMGKVVFFIAVCTSWRVAFRPSESAGRFSQCEVALLMLFSM